MDGWRGEDGMGWDGMVVGFTRYSYHETIRHVCNYLFWSFQSKLLFCIFTLKGRFPI